MQNKYFKIEDKFIRVFPVISSKIATCWGRLQSQEKQMNIKL